MPKKLSLQGLLLQTFFLHLWSKDKDIYSGLQNKLGAKKRGSCHQTFLPERGKSSYVESNFDLWDGK